MSLNSRTSDRIWLAIYIFFAFVISVFTLHLILLSGSAPKREIKAGCIFNGSIDEPGWSGNNYAGIKSACEEYNVELIIKQNVPEEAAACEEAVRSLVSEGCGMIFLTSYGYAGKITDVIKSYPSVAFFSTCPCPGIPNLSYYLGRMYQGRYLSGILAGMTTQTGNIGYVAAMPNNEVNRGINAFALGVRSVRPDARIFVRFSGQWDDEPAEKSALEKLRAYDIDIVTYHQNKENIPYYADKSGLKFIAYHEAAEEYPGTMLADIICSWDKIYGNMIRDYIRGDIELSHNYWLGLGEDAVELKLCSGQLSSEAVQKIREAEKMMTGGMDVFAGLIRDNCGNIRCQTDERLSDAVIADRMDWYAEGVTIDED